jgi:hypothetical protein
MYTFVVTNSDERALTVSFVIFRILKLRQLVSLDLSGNAVKDISILGDASTVKLESLKELKLARNQVTKNAFLRGSTIMYSGQLKHPLMAVKRLRVKGGRAF